MDFINDATLATVENSNQGMECLTENQYASSPHLNISTDETVDALLQSPYSISCRTLRRFHVNDIALLSDQLVLGRGTKFTEYTGDPLRAIHTEKYKSTF